MKTKIIDLKDFSSLDESIIEEKIIESIKDIKNGEIVAFPTETVYGLGGNALNPEAIEKIFKIKKRPQDNPLIVHIGSINEIDNLIDESKTNHIRLEKAIKYWPGPISFIFPAKKEVLPDITTGGLSTVAIRFPDHRIAQILIKKAGLPIAAPSANISGKPSCTKAEDVFTDFNGSIRYIIDGGDSVYGIESTVVDLTSDPPAILRPGFISKEDLINDFPDIRLINPSQKEIIPKSPGMKYTHYKPDAKVIILLKEIELENFDKIFEFKSIFKNRILKTTDILISNIMINKSILLTNNLDNDELFDKKNYIEKSHYINSYEFAKNLYSKFREADKKKIKYLFVRPFVKANGIELAILNRLIKASEEIWIF
ncbi:MAG: L-threonylcarbamoyladenylate synthase [Exilispira sp.]